MERFVGPVGLPRRPVCESVRTGIKLEAKCGRAGLNNGVVGNTGIVSLY